MPARAARARRRMATFDCATRCLACAADADARKRGMNMLPSRPHLCATERRGRGCPRRAARCCRARVSD
eukprot:11196274-Lingulodinium_polyedra.AAC.1